MATKNTRQEKVFNQLAALPDEASRVKFLSRHRRLLSPSTVKRLDEALGVTVQIDLVKAERLVDIQALPYANDRVYPIYSALHLSESRQRQGGIAQASRALLGRNFKGKQLEEPPVSVTQGLKRGDRPFFRSFLCTFLITMV